MKKIFDASWFIVLIWLVMIFFLSAQPAKNSNQLSKSVTRGVITTGEMIGVVKEGTVSKTNILNNLNNKIRNYAHSGVYFILGILVMNAFRKSGINTMTALILTFLACAIYASLDELHQTFVPGRGAQLGDFLRDCIGAGLGLIIYISTSFLYRTNVKTK